MDLTAEKVKLHDALAKAFDVFTAALRKFSETELNKVPFAGSWTPAQVAQHVILATDSVFDGNTRSSDRPIDALLPQIRPWWEDLSQRFTSPEPLRPDVIPRSYTALLAELIRVREKDLQITLNKDLGLVCLDFELPSVGYLTRFEWLWFIEMHLRRHIAQLERIRKAIDQH